MILKRNTRPLPLARSAFSLVELLIVVAIIALLVAIILTVAGKAFKIVRSWDAPPPPPPPALPASQP